MDECMDGWMDEWVNEWMNEWVDEWRSGWVDGWMNEWMNDSAILPSTCLSTLTFYPETPWSGKWQPTPVFLPGKFHGQRSLAGCSPGGHKESDTTEDTPETHPFSPSCCCLVLSHQPPSSPLNHSPSLLLASPPKQGPKYFSGAGGNSFFLV